MLLGLMNFCSVQTLVPTVAEPPESMSVEAWRTAWTKVLERSVDSAGRIDFSALKSDPEDIVRVVAFVAKFDPVSEPDRFPSHEERVAFYINAYNALAMYGVLDAGMPKSFDGFISKVRFFYLRSFIVGGRQISLYELENDVIRPLGDARVHFALNCMVVSCPRLPREAFMADVLDRQLDAAARSFVSEDRNVRVDLAKNEVWLSSIFDFYTKDFLGNAPSLVAYVNRYRSEPVSTTFRVRFFRYDWTINAAAPRDL